MIFHLIIYAFFILGSVAGVLIVIALASNKCNGKNDVDAFYEAKTRCKSESYDEILEKCRKKVDEGKVNFFNVEDLEIIVKELES